MQGRFYPDVFSKEGIALALPDERDQAYIHHIYLNELVKGIIRPETREQLFAIADRLKESDDIQGLILGGTELSLILREPTVRDIPVLDTTRIHARAIVAEAFLP
jgi:aspartate racemase